MQTSEIVFLECQLSHYIIVVNNQHPLKLRFCKTNQFRNGIKKSRIKNEAINNVAAFIFFMMSSKCYLKYINRHTYHKNWRKQEKEINEWNDINNLIGNIAMFMNCLIAWMLKTKYVTFLITKPLSSENKLF